MSQSPFDHIHPKSTPHPSTTETYNTFMDDSEAQDTEEIRQQQNLKNALEEMLSTFEKLSKKLPDTIRISNIERLDKTELKKLEDGNHKIEQFRQDFWNFYKPSLKYELGITTATQSEKPPSTSTSTSKQNSQHQEISEHSAQSYQEQLQLQPILLEKLIQIASDIQSICSQIEKQSAYINDNLKTAIVTEVITEIKKYFVANPQENLLEKDTVPDEKPDKHRSEITQTRETQSQQVFSQSSNEYQLPWVSKYNQNPDYFATFALEVSATEESINQRRLGTNQAVIIEKVKKGRGNYWLLADTNEHYLVPKGELKINQYNLPTIAALFQCTGESPENSQKFTLVRPAMVFPIESEKWQLETVGMLKFEA
ncbi:MULTISPECIES: hypothetical protein [Calothrix]|uniref:Uncharacterized protein n=2 Tax=Calothrix TaxID=1186 RepID=A0ABR8AJI5_9CYAN|nr:MULTISPECIES: hypothetical protein [Calothrix]MBD2199433.1 hypothetical protein [Calothrix parietina FACHB-288]MBD2228234.1 hypothetical protein [Calothrix anomala FACHB-343]